MAHPDQQKYCNGIKQRFPLFFQNRKVLDIGSLDVNGNNRYLFENCNYIGLDIAPGKNVDIVCVAHKYDIENEFFDTIISTNALEHDIYYELTLKKMVSLLKPGGFLIFSVANSFGEHGTKRKSPTDSNTSKMNETWANYYKNLTPADITKVLNLQEIFSKYNLEIIKKDLTFWGIKREK
jgi:SAM-dependent methyltransferase